MSKNQYYKEFNVDLSTLADWEKELVEILKKVTKLCGDIYVKQKNTKFPGANFYPHDVTRTQVEKSARKNPQILDHYTIVQKDSKGNLVAIPYHKVYDKEIVEMHRLVLDAAKLHRKADYKNYLKQFADDLMKSNYTESEKLWLQMNGNNVDIRLGPIELYHDKLMGVKRAFQANLRILDKSEQENVEDYVDVILGLQPSTPFTQNGDSLNLDVRVDTVIAWGGWHADLEPRGSNYPEDTSLYKYGAKVLMYVNSTSKSNDRLWRLAKETMCPDVLNEISKDTFMKNAMRQLLFHEIAEAIGRIRYSDYPQRLTYMADTVREIFSTLVGVKSASIQVLKGVLSTKDYQAMLAALIMESLRSWHMGKIKGRAVQTYTRGYILATSYLLENSAIRIDSNDGICVDYPKIFSSLESISTMLTQVMSMGRTKQAEKLFDSYTDDSFMKKFETVVEKIYKD